MTSAIASSSFESPTSNSNDKSNIHNLPHELLINIFRLATNNPIRDINSLISYKPFEGLYVPERVEACREALRTKYSLTLACRLFWTLMPEFLYEDIWIRYGSDGLREVLEKSKNAENTTGEGVLGYGKFVKRVSLTPTAPIESHKSILENAREILSRCPYVLVVNRPSQVQVSEGAGAGAGSEGEEEDGDLEKLVLEFIKDNPSMDDLKLSDLKRVEWNNTVNNSLFSTSSIPSPFLFSESLRILILGAGNFPNGRGVRGHGSNVSNIEEEEMVEETIISLPNVHTLSIQSLDTFGEPSPNRRYTISLPSLQHIILRRPEAIFNFFNDSLNLRLSSSTSTSTSGIGSQITSLEIHQDFRFLRQDVLSPLLSSSSGYCPNISSLYFPIFSTRPIPPNTIPHIFLEFRSVRRVYVNARLPKGYKYGQEAWWMMLETHFYGLCGRNSGFVGLEGVILSGKEWLGCLRMERFKYALQIVRGRGRGRGREFENVVEIESDDEDVRRELSLVLDELDLDLASESGN